MTGRIDIYGDLDALSRGVANSVVEAASRAISRDGRFLWCLEGGRSARPAYELLATDEFARQVAWNRTHVFFGDERCVPPDDVASNYRMARDALLSRVPVPADQVHRIAGEQNPARAARDYERTLRSVLGGSPAGLPAHPFDLVLLGMGADGHTASLFPGSEEEIRRWVVPRRNPSDGGWRVTLTPLVIDTARAIRFVVAGREKAERLADVLAGPRRPRELPVHRIRPAGELIWMVDREASTELIARDAGGGDS